MARFWPVVLCGLLAGGASACFAQGPEELAPHIDPQRRISDIQLERYNGHLVVVVPSDDGEARITPAQYFAALEARRELQEENGFLFTLFNITGWAGVLWVVMGLAGQVLFTGRMVVQWLVSEREHRSVVPPSFWWMSLIGATMLLLYFTWRKDIVGFLGQATGWSIYVRNLWMIYHPDPPAASQTTPVASSSPS